MMTSLLPIHPWKPPRLACRSRPTALQALSISLPNLPAVEFPHMGSGLLFARTTGLKIWPASEAISKLLLDADVLHHTASRHPTLAAQHAAQGTQYSLSGLIVVELGAGLGLCSVAAAAAGAQMVATDGDSDLTRLLQKNLKHNWARLQQNNPALDHATPPRAGLLPWGDESAITKLGLPAHQPTSREAGTAPNTASSSSTAGSSTGPDVQVDVVLLADCIYGSNPGVWQRLVDTLRALVSPQTLVIQAESPRIEGVLYGEYWSMLTDAGFHWEQVWPAAEPEPTSTPDPAAEPEPISTPDPTAEPEPTSTPDPAAEPEPTSTPDPVSVQSTHNRQGGRIGLAALNIMPPGVRMWVIHRPS